eukprot:690113-Hanusia_phi.AAC.1
MSQKFDTSSFQPQVDSAWYAPVLEWGQSLMSFGETTAQTKPVRPVCLPMVLELSLSVQFCP